MDPPVKRGVIRRVQIKKEMFFTIAGNSWIKLWIRQHQWMNLNKVEEMLLSTTHIQDSKIGNLGSGLLKYYVLFERAVSLI